MAVTSRKTILITGVTRGCGRALVDEFTRLSHVVLGCGRSKEAINELTKLFGTPPRFPKSQRYR